MNRSLTAATRGDSGSIFGQRIANRHYKMIFPEALIRANAEGDWPFGRRLSGSLLAGSASLMLKLDFELLSINEICENERSEVADMETLRTFAKKPQLARMFRLYSSFNPEGTSDLPWLDVEKALVIGGGADYGDDMWIVLDARLDPIAPRVVLNEFCHFGLDGARTAPSHVVWIELAPNVECFLSMLGHCGRCS